MSEITTAPPADVLASIRSILDYDWATELRDYEQEGEPEGHIFEHLQRVNRWLEDDQPAPVETVQITSAQAEAIAAQTMIYYTDDAPDVTGLARPPKIVMDADRLAVYAGTLTDGMVAVEFHYAYADDWRAEGLEVTVYAADGSVVTSQDYG